MGNGREFSLHFGHVCVRGINTVGALLHVKLLALSDHVRVRTTGRYCDLTSLAKHSVIENSNDQFTHKLEAS